MRTPAHRRGFVTAVLVAVSLLAAACGDDDDDSDASTQPSRTEVTGQTATTSPAAASTTSGGATTAAPEPSDIDPAGVLKFGTPLISGVGVHFDTTKIRGSAPNITWMELIYGTLMRQADGELVPWMAEDVEVEDAQTVTITLRPGMKFSDGSAYDATALKLSMERQRFEYTGAVQQAQNVGYASLASVDIVDPLTVTVNLDKPLAAVFLETLASTGGVIHSPKQIAEAPADIDTKPIGAGPFVLESFVVDQSMTLKKNPDFFDADSWKMAEIRIIHTPNGPPQTNGLLSDTVDVVVGVPIGDMPAIERDSDLESEVVTTRYYTMLMCLKPPFDNEAVRKAIAKGIDRDELNELIYDGLGVPAYGYYKEDHPSYDPETKELLTYDVNGAKKLLADANVADVTFDLVFTSTNNQIPEAEVIQAQLEKIGVHANIVPLDNLYANFIEPQKPGAILAPLSGEPVGGYTIFNNHHAQGASQLYCSTGHPDVLETVEDAVTVAPDDPKSIEAYKQANLTMIEHAYQIPLIFIPQPVVWNSSRVGGTLDFNNLGGQPRLNFEALYVKK